MLTRQIRSDRSLFEQRIVVRTPRSVLAIPMPSSRWLSSNTSKARSPASGMTGHAKIKEFRRCEKYDYDYNSELPSETEEDTKRSTAHDTVLLRWSLYHLGTEVPGRISLGSLSRDR